MGYDLESGNYTISVHNHGDIGALFFTFPTEIGTTGGTKWEVEQYGNGSYSLVAFDDDFAKFYVESIREPGGAVILSAHRPEHKITWHIDYSHRPDVYTIQYAHERPDGPEKHKKYWTLDDGRIVLDTLGPHPTQEFIFERDW